MSDLSWRPDEDAATIYAEDTWLVGSLLFCMTYGAIATLSIQCCTALVKGFKRSKMFRDGPLLAFVVLTFLVNTIFMGVAVQFTMQAFVNDRNFSADPNSDIPAGPDGYEIAEFDIPIDSVANACMLISTFLSDALLLWRCTIIYKNSRIPGLVSAGLAIAFWLTELTLGVLFLVQLYSSSQAVWGTVNLTLGFWCFSLALNLLATGLIVGRLFFYRRRLSRILGASYGSQYTGVIAMVVESELLYTAYLILFITLFILNHPVVNILLQGVSSAQVVAALMIVYRVAQGKGWTSETHTFVTAGAAGSSIQLSNLSALRAGGSSTLVEEAVKGDCGNGVHVVQEVYTRKDSMTGEGSV